MLFESWHVKITARGIFLDLKEVNLSPYCLVQREDFGDAWIEALYNAVTYGKGIVFGTREEQKHALDTTQTIVLTGKALEQIERGEIHPGTGEPGSGLGKHACEQYKNECNRDWYNNSYKLLPPEDQKRFVYLYIERLIDTYGDQLAKVRELVAESMATGIASNRHQAITWLPSMDLDNPSPPCFQRVWVRWYKPNYIDLHLNWRSRDLRNAFQENIVAIYAMMNREVALPNQCRIVRLIDQSDSLHVYRGAVPESAEIIRAEFMRNPGLMRQLAEI